MSPKLEHDIRSRVGIILMAVEQLGALLKLAGSKEDNDFFNMIEKNAREILEELE